MLLDERFYAEHKRSIRAYARKNANTSSDADDLEQEIWLKLLKANVNPSVERAFVYYVARKTFLTQLASKYRHSRIRVIEPSALLDTPKQKFNDTGEMFAESVREVISELPDADIPAFDVILGRTSTKEYCEKLGVREPAARKRIRKLKNRLRNRLMENTNVCH